MRVLLSDGVRLTFRQPVSPAARVSGCPRFRMPAFPDARGHVPAGAWVGRRRAGGWLARGTPASGGGGQAVMFSVAGTVSVGVWALWPRTRAMAKPARASAASP